MLLKSIRFIIILLLILNSGSILFLKYEELNILIPIFVLLLYFLHFQNKVALNIKISKKLILFICLFLSFISICHILYLETDFSIYFGLIVKIISILFFLQFYKNKYNNFGKLAEDIYSVLKFVLFLAILNIFIVQIFESFFKFSDLGVYAYTIYGIFNYLSTISILDITIYRNQGLFWEPGALQMFINILLYISLFVYKNIKITISSIVVIFSTFSTTGILIMFILLSAYYLKDKSKNYKLLGFIPVVMIFLPIIVYTLYDKFTDVSSLSAPLRMYDFYIGTQILIDNFLIGIGFNPDFYLELQIDKLNNFVYINEPRGNTNGILIIGIYFGLIALLLYLFMLKNQKIFNYGKNLIFLVLFLSLASEPFSFTGFLLLIVLSSVVFKENKKIKINKL